MNIESFPLSQKAIDQLGRIKTATGIDTRNVLCRWAFCLSLSDVKVPEESHNYNDTVTDMSWKVFGGENDQIYLALLKQRCHKDNIKVCKEALAVQFKLHLNRGISMLLEKIKNKRIEDLLSLSLTCKN